MNRVAVGIIVVLLLVAGIIFLSRMVGRLNLRQLRGGATPIPAASVIMSLSSPSPSPQPTSLPGSEILPQSGVLPATGL